MADGQDAKDDKQEHEKKGAEPKSDRQDNESKYVGKDKIKIDNLRIATPRKEGDVLVEFDFIIEPAILEGDSRSIQAVKDKFTDNSKSWVEGFMKKYDSDKDGSITIEEASKEDKEPLNKALLDHKDAKIASKEELKKLLDADIKNLFETLKKIDADKEKGNNDGRFDKKELKELEEALKSPPPVFAKTADPDQPEKS